MFSNRKGGCVYNAKFCINMPGQLENEDDATERYCIIEKMTCSLHDCDTFYSPRLYAVSFVIYFGVYFGRDSTQS